MITWRCEFVVEGQSAWTDSSRMTTGSAVEQSKEMNLDIVMMRHTNTDRRSDRPTTNREQREPPFETVTVLRGGRPFNAIELHGTSDDGETGRGRGPGWRQTAGSPVRTVNVAVVNEAILIRYTSVTWTASAKMVWSSGDRGHGAMCLITDDGRLRSMLTVPRRENRNQFTIDVVERYAKLYQVTRVETER